MFHTHLTCVVNSIFFSSQCLSYDVSIFLLYLGGDFNDRMFVPFHSCSNLNLSNPFKCLHFLYCLFFTSPLLRKYSYLRLSTMLTRSPMYSHMLLHYVNHNVWTALGAGVNGTEPVCEWLYWSNSYPQCMYVYSWHTHRLVQVPVLT